MVLLIFLSFAHLKISFSYWFKETKYIYLWLVFCPLYVRYIYLSQSVAHHFAFYISSCLSFIWKKKMKIVTTTQLHIIAEKTEWVNIFKTFRTVSGTWKALYYVRVFAIVIFALCQGVTTIYYACKTTIYYIVLQKMPSASFPIPISSSLLTEVYFRSTKAWTLSTLAPVLYWILLCSSPLMNMHVPRA